MRTVYGNHQRYETTYFKKFPGYYCTGDGMSLFMCYQEVVLIYCKNSKRNIKSNYSTKSVIKCLQSGFCISYLSIIQHCCINILSLISFSRINLLFTTQYKLFTYQVMSCHIHDCYSVIVVQSFC